MIKLVEIKKTPPGNPRQPLSTVQYELEEIWINPAAVIQVKADSAMKYNLDNGYLPDGLDTRQEFSRVHFGAGNNIVTATVVGPPSSVAEKIQKKIRTKVLKG